MKNRLKGFLVNKIPYTVTNAGLDTKVITLSHLSNFKTGDIIYFALMDSGVIQVIPKKITVKLTKDILVITDKSYKVFSSGKSNLRVTLPEILNAELGSGYYQEIMENKILLLIPEKLFDKKL